MVITPSRRTFETLHNSIYSMLKLFITFNNFNRNGNTNLCENYVGWYLYLIAIFFKEEINNIA